MLDLEPNGLNKRKKSLSYFFGFERRRQEKNKINILMVNDEECSDAKVIAEEIYKFYCELYSSSFSVEDSLPFLESIKNYIPQIDIIFELSDSEIIMKELDVAVKQMSLGKAPGLTSNFYKFFWEDIKVMLFSALEECIENDDLMSTMKQGIIILLPKHGKHKRYIDNLRPITLSNVDYKLVVHIIANHLKENIGQIKSETQSGFINERSIHNIRLVLDLLVYNDLIEDEGFILFLDFYKAFNSVEHLFIMKSLEYFGFGSKFIKIIGMMYKDIKSSVSLPQGTSRRFEAKRGIK